MKTFMSFLFFAAIMLFSCSKEDEPNPIQIEKSFQIGDQYSSENNSLKFKVTAIQESRCPSDVVCVWEGEAIVKVDVESPFTGTLELSTYDNQVDTLNNYSFELMEVSPYPISTEVIDLEDYEITLKVKELD